MRSVMLGLVLIMACKPDGIATASCESIMLAVGEPWECRVSGPTVSQASSIHFDTESRNQIADVKMTLRVNNGALQVTYRDLSGDKRVVVTREAPLAVRMQTKLHRDHRSFTVAFDPLGKHVEGLEGTVHYSTP